MIRILGGVERASRLLHAGAGFSLVFLMLLTVTDVVLRTFRHPVPGTYELVGFSGALAIGLAMPITSWLRGHVHVDLLLGWLPPAGRAAVQVITRLMSTGLFVLLCWNLFRFGLDLRSAGEVSPTLELPFYPVAFGLALACAVQALVVLCDLVRIHRGEYE